MAHIMLLFVQQHPQHPQRIVLNTDSTKFGGSGTKMQKTYTSKPIPMHSFEQSISLTLPGLSVVYLKKQGKKTNNKEE